MCGDVSRGEREREGGKMKCYDILLQYFMVGSVLFGHFKKFCYSFFLVQRIAGN